METLQDIFPHIRIKMCLGIRVCLNCFLVFMCLKSKTTWYLFFVLLLNSISGLLSGNIWRNLSSWMPQRGTSAQVSSKLLQKAIGTLDDICAHQIILRLCFIASFLWIPSYEREFHSYNFLILTIMCSQQMIAGSLGRAELLLLDGIPMLLL